MTHQKNSIQTVLYDDEVDVLYLKYSSNKNATAREIGANIIVYFDDVTGEPTTITILDFKWLEQNRPLWRSGLPIAIDFDKDVLPFIH